MIMNDGIIEINTNDTDGILASLSTLSGELSSISSGDINCSCGEINSLCGGAISAAISKLDSNNNDASSVLQSNNAKINEIVEDMYNFDVVTEGEPFSFEDVISFMSKMESSSVHRADEQFFRDAGYEVVDGTVTISGEDGVYTYNIHTGELTLPNGSSLEVAYYVPDNYDDLSSLNTITCLAGQGEMDVFSTTGNNSFNLDKLKTNSILVCPSKKGQKGVNLSKTSYSFMCEEVIGSTKFAKTFSRQQAGCQNIIGGCSSGGGSALNIAGQAGDLYDTVFCINYAPLVKGVNDGGKGKNGIDDNRMTEEVARNLNGKNLFFFSSSGDPNITDDGKSKMCSGIKLLLDYCPDSQIYVATNRNTNAFDFPNPNYHKLDSEFWNNYASNTGVGVDKKGNYSGHGSYHGMFMDLINSSLMDRNVYNS